MEVRWRLFARDVLSMPIGDDGEFLFGKPPRPVRGLRILGVVVHRSRSRSLLDLDKGADSRIDSECGGGGGGGGASGGGDGMDGDCGSLAVDDGTGVIEVRLPLQLWDSVALNDQVDIVGTPETGTGGRGGGSSSSSGGRGNSAGSSAGSVIKSAGSGNRRRGRRHILGVGCCVETDPNTSTLRALECINLYKTCYFSLAWSPSASAVPLPPLRPDPRGEAAFQTDGNPSRNAGAVIVSGVVGREGGEKGDDGGMVDGGATLEERLLGMVENTGGATREQLVAKLGGEGLCRGRQDGEEIAAALAEMQLHGAIYLAGDRYMAL